VAPPEAKPPAIGTRLSVRFQGGEVHRGTVAAQGRHGRIHIRYDDGEEEWVVLPDPDITLDDSPVACSAPQPLSKAVLCSPRRLVGCLVCKGNGSGKGTKGKGKGSAGVGSMGMRGVIVQHYEHAECATPAPVRAPVQFRVQFADGSEERVDGGQVRAMLLDAADRAAAIGASTGGRSHGDGDDGGGGFATCPVCFDDFGLEPGVSEPGVTPCILECGHVFCTACVGRICALSAAGAGAAGTTRRGTSIRCPLCQARHRL
jgi:hypothetical protein